MLEEHTPGRLTRETLATLRPRSEAMMKTSQLPYIRLPKEIVLEKLAIEFLTLAAEQSAQPAATFFLSQLF
jgi:hypothetical protein